MDSAAMYAARTKKLAAISCWARRSAAAEDPRPPVNNQTITEPASASIKESAPNPISAIEPAAIPAPTAMANSMTCQALPPQASSRARRSSRALSPTVKGRPSVPVLPTCKRSGTTGFLMADMLEPDVEQETDVGVVQRVIDVPTLLSIPDQPIGAKQPQVVRAGGLGETGHRGQIADAELTRFQQRRDQAHAPRIGEHPERLGEILENVLGREAVQDHCDELWIDALDLATIEPPQARE